MQFHVERFLDLTTHFDLEIYNLLSQYIHDALRLIFYASGYQSL